MSCKHPSVELLEITDLGACIPCLGDAETEFSVNVDKLRSIYFSLFQTNVSSECLGHSAFQSSLKTLITCAPGEYSEKFIAVFGSPFGYKGVVYPSLLAYCIIHAKTDVFNVLMVHLTNDSNYKTFKELIRNTMDGVCALPPENIWLNHPEAFERFIVSLNVYLKGNPSLGASRVLSNQLCKAYLGLSTQVLDSPELNLSFKPILSYMLDVYVGLIGYQDKYDNDILKKQNEQLSKNVSALKGMCRTSLESLQSAEASRKTAEAARETAEAAKDRAEYSALELTKTVAALEAEIARLQGELDTVDDKKCHLAGAIDEAQSVKKQLEGNSVIISRLEDKIASLTQANVALKSKSKRASNAASTSKAALREAERQVREKTEEITKLSEEIMHLKAALTGQSAVEKEHAATLQAEKEKSKKLQQDVSNKARQTANLNQTISGLKAKLEIAEKGLAQVESNHSTEKAASIAQVQALEAELQAAATSGTEKDSKITELEEQVRDLRAQVVELEKRLAVTIDSSAGAGAGSETTAALKVESAGIFFSSPIPFEVYAEIGAQFGIAVGPENKQMFIKGSYADPRNYSEKPDLDIAVVIPVGALIPAIINVLGNVFSKDAKYDLYKGKLRGMDVDIAILRQSASQSVEDVLLEEMSKTLIPVKTTFVEPCNPLFYIRSDVDINVLEVSKPFEEWDENDVAYFMKAYAQNLKQGERKRGIGKVAYDAITSIVKLNTDVDFKAKVRKGAIIALRRYWKGYSAELKQLITIDFALLHGFLELEPGCAAPSVIHGCSYKFGKHWLFECFLATNRETCEARFNAFFEDVKPVALRFDFEFASYLKAKSPDSVAQVPTALLGGGATAAAFYPGMPFSAGSYPPLPEHLAGAHAMRYPPVPTPPYPPHAPPAPRR